MQSEVKLAEYRVEFVCCRLSPGASGLVSRTATVEKSG